MNLQFTLEFLKELALNNSKEWMDDNKKRYQEAKQQVIELVSEVIHQMQDIDPSLTGIDPRKTLFRINRDIRFSNNKDPYKTNFGAFLVEGGRQSGNPGYYMHIMPSNNFIGGGIYQPSPETLQKVRQEIDNNGNEIRQIIEKKEFVKIYSKPFDEDKLKTAPRGYPKDHENLDLLQLKHYVFMRSVTNDELLSDNFIEKVVESFIALYPFNQFLQRAIE